MNLPWDQIQLFLAVAETGSLSAASKRLGVGQPTVTRRLQQLEHDLGYALFRRHANGVSPTSEGERLLEPARRMAQWAGEVTRTAAKADGAPSGVVRVTAPPGVAFDFLAPFAAWLATEHPKLRLEVLSAVEYLDLARGEADLALRFRAPPPGGDLISAASLRHPVAAFVSERYRRSLPENFTASDIAWICWAPPFEQVPPNPQLEALVPGFKRAFTSDNYLVQLRAAEQGVGAMVLGNLRHRFSSSTLVPLDLDLGPHAFAELHLVAAKSALDISRVRTVAHLMAEALGMSPADG